MKNFPLRITLLYLFLGISWIIVSGIILPHFVTQSEFVVQAEMFKGIFYVAVTAVLLFFLVKRETGKEKRTREKLKRANSKMTSLITNLPGVVYQCLNDKNWTITYISEQCAEVTGYTREEFMSGRVSWNDLIDERDKEETLTEMRNSLNKRIPFQLVYRMHDKSGAERWIWEQAEGVYDENGEAIGLDGFFQDITKQIKAEQELHALNQELEMRVLERTAELEEANNELQAYNSGVSHDLRTSLRGIELYASMIERKYKALSEQEIRDHVANIRGIVKNANSFIESLLDYARVKGKEVNYSDCDMEALVADVYGKLSQHYEESRIKFTVNSTLPSAWADPLLMRQMWENLISNALKFSRKKDQAKIEILGSREDGKVTYMIKDNGAGFDNKYAARIFSDFERMHDKEEFEGTGVGLAIVRRIVEKHGGDVWAEGQAGEGATFFFSLPVKEKARLN